jgi:hypothetical protein
MGPDLFKFLTSINGPFQHALLDKADAIDLVKEIIIFTKPTELDPIL